MILFFADRRLNIVGSASTELPKGLTITNDNQYDDVETGVTIFECEIPFDESTMRKVEECTAVGNYILRSNEGKNEYLTIVEREKDTKAQTVYIYAEDAGLDLFNEICVPYAADKAYPIDHYINKFAYDSGFVIGINEVPNLTRKLSWDGESTATARIASVATQFDNCEISYSFDVENFRVTKKYINIHKKRGKDIGIELRLNRDIDRIVTKESITNLATALKVTGGTPEDADNPINLSGYTYDDGDIYLDGTYLKSRKAVAIWSRYLAESGNYTGHIMRTFTYDTTSRPELCNRAVEHLKQVSQIEVNYEIDLSRLPEDVRIGDRVNIVDDAGELYMSARVLKLERSVCNQSHKATLGEYLIKKHGISQKVTELAIQFSKAAQDAAKALVSAKLAGNTAEAANNIAESAERAVYNANVAAQTAKSKADEASTAAARAEAQAADASAAVVVAQGKAETAITKADAAKESADSAASTATTAKTTAEAAKLDAQKASQDVAALGEQLKTVSQTMTAEYARKTDLTETEASLQSQISQNAAQISSTVSRIETVDETANNAAEQAAQAQSQANTAKQQAAQAVADAQAAQTAANNASTSAANAQSQATTATAAAQAAKSVADQAEADLATAKANLASVTSRVGATEEEIAAAQAAVNTAQAAADKAKADASTAQATADKAKTDAATAQTAANNAKKAADDAQADADAAKKAADDAQAAADALAVRVTKAETDIKQTADSITLLATKEEVTQTLGGYYTKTQTDAKIKVASDAIEQQVSIADNLGSRMTTMEQNADGFNWQIDEVVENMKIGGRNVIADTDATTEYSGNKGSNSYKDVWAAKTIDIPTGTEYVVSFDAKADVAQTINCYFYSPNTTTKAESSTGHSSTSADGSCLVSITTEWKRYWVKWTQTATTSAKNVIIGRNFATTNVYIRAVKLEEGNQPTSWSPAPEDGAKTASNFMSYDSTNGLLVGNKSSGSWSGYRAQIKNDSYNILDANGNTLSSFGANTVELGKNNANTAIKFCNGKAQFRYDASEGGYTVLEGAAQRIRGEKTTALLAGSGTAHSDGSYTQANLYGVAGDADNDPYLWLKAGREYPGIDTVESEIFVRPGEIDVNAFDSIRIVAPSVAVEGGFGIDGDATTSGFFYDKFGNRINNGLAVYDTGAIDPNTTTEELILTKTNTPISGTLFFVKTFFYNNKSSNRTQLAIPYNISTFAMYGRKCVSGTWSDWKRILDEENSHNHAYTTTAGWFRLNNGWIGMYASESDAVKNSDRKGWIGYDNGDIMKVYDQKGGIDVISTAGTIRFAPEGNTNKTAMLTDRFRPITNDQQYLGDSTFKWKAVYAVNGTIQTSDRNQKTNIAEINQRYIDLFDRLLPVSFEFSDAESDRTHIGFISQDVEAAMAEVGLTDLDFAGFCKDVAMETVEEIDTNNPVLDDAGEAVLGENGAPTYHTKEVEKPVLDEAGNPVYIYSLRYSEFIALNTRMIQLSREQIAKQQEEIESLKADMDELKRMVRALTAQSGIEVVSNG